MSIMSVNGCHAEINCPQALTGNAVNALPPFAKVKAYVVDEYPACPKEWMHGSGKASSYFIGVEPGRGMWFDFTTNMYNDYDCAVVISVQGVNPLTGQKVAGLRLEQYKDQCPIHKIDFLQDRFCSECEYKWPAQNYIATTTGQSLWLDGFRNGSGEVRQYILTEEEVNRGVAQQMIGEDRVWAIGFAFYKSKEKKPVTLDNKSKMFSQMASAQYGMCNTLSGSWINCSDSHHKFSHNSLARSLSANTPVFDMSIDDEYEELTSFGDIVSSKKVEIGAGSRISQEIGVDNNDTDYWESEPAGLIYVNYTTLDHVSKILDAGKRKELKEGFLNSVKVGN